MDQNYPQVPPIWHYIKINCQTINNYLANRKEFNKLSDIGIVFDCHSIWSN